MDEDWVKERKIITAFKETERATDLLDQITMMKERIREIGT